MEIKSHNMNDFSLENIKRLRDMLNDNNPGEMMDLIWGPDLDFEKNPPDNKENDVI